jgi:hypothetical protein
MRVYFAHPTSQNEILISSHNLFLKSLLGPFPTLNFASLDIIDYEAKEYFQIINIFF